LLGFASSVLQIGNWLLPKPSRPSFLLAPSMKLNISNPTNGGQKTITIEDESIL
jgi:hypothetical protein